jgi:hypothetical protein
MTEGTVMLYKSYPIRLLPRSWCDFTLKEVTNKCIGLNQQRYNPSIQMNRNVVRIVERELGRIFDLLIGRKENGSHGNVDTGCARSFRMHEAAPDWFMAWA